MASPISFGVDIKNKGITVGSGNDKLKIGKDGVSIAGIPILGKTLDDATNPRKPLGPLSALDLNKYKSNQSLMYPLDIDKYRHRIKFSINVPERSKFNTDERASGDVSIANMNMGVATNPEAANMVQSKMQAAGVVVAGGLAGIISKAGSIATSAIKGFVRNGLKGAIKAGGISSAAAGLVGAAKGAVSAAALSKVSMERKTRRIVQTIHLYIPDTVQSTLVNSYDAVSLTEASGMAGFLNQGVDAAGQSVKELMDKISGGPGANRSGVTGGFSNEALAKMAQSTGFTGDVNALIQASSGLAINPAIDVLFKAIAPREFQFDFKFTPRSQKEAAEILNIIKAFRFHAAPEFAKIDEQAGRYLIPPSEFDIEYQFDNGWNPALPKISTCVLEGVDINYVTAGQWATYEDGMPIEIGMQLRFKEVQTLHKDLIEQGF